MTLRIQSVSLSFYQPLLHRLSSSLYNWNSAHTVLAEQSLHRCFIESAVLDVESLQTVLQSALRHRLHDVLERSRGRLEVRFSVWMTSIVETQELGVVFVCGGEVQSSRAADVAVPDHEALGVGRRFDDLLQVGRS